MNDEDRKARYDEHELDRLEAVVPPARGHRELWVGLFAIVAVVATLVVLFTLTDAATFRGRNIVSTILDDAAGIRQGDPVRMRGVNIGRVYDFHIQRDGDVAVRLELEGEYDVPVDSRIVLRSAGMLQGMVAEVVPGKAEEMVSGGETLSGAVERDVFAAAEELGVEADTVLDRVARLLSPTLIEDVGVTTSQLRTLVAELNRLIAQQRGELAAVTSSLRGAAAGVERATGGEELERAVQRLDSLTLRLDAATENLTGATASLETVLARVARGEGTLGRLTTEDSLYVNMNETVLSIQRLVQDIQANPGRYINLRVF